MARHFKPYLLTLVLGLFMPLCTQGAVTLLEDNFVFKGNPTQIQDGSATTLTIKGPAPSQINTRTIYLKFDLTDHTTAEGNFANLVLTTTSSTSTSSFSFALYALNTGGAAWTESPVSGVGGINWANSPGLGTGDYELSTTGTTFLGNFNSLSAGTAVGSQISTTFSNWNNYRQADNSLTLIIVGTAQSDAGPSISFASSENTTAGIRPTLNLSPIPEPTRTLLLCAGAAGFTLRRRRPSCDTGL